MGVSWVFSFMGVSCSLLCVAEFREGFLGE